MLNKKRVVASIGVGIVIFALGFFLLLFTYKLLNSPQWMLTAMTWILIWPHLLLAKVGLPYPGIVVALSIGPITDIAILSGIIYAVLSLLMGKPPNTSPPPPPSRFE